MMTLWRHVGDGALPRQIEIWKLICSFLDVFVWHPLCQKPLRLLWGTPSVLLDSMMTLLETHWRWSTSQAGRDLKIDMQLPWCILGTSIMSKTNKTPLRNLHRPLKLLGGRSGELRCYTTSQDGRDLKINTSLPWCILSIGILHVKNHQDPIQEPPMSLNEALENPWILPLSRKVEMSRFINSPRFNQIQHDSARFNQIHPDSSWFNQIYPDSLTFTQIQPHSHPIHPHSAWFDHIHPHSPTFTCTHPDSSTFIHILPDMPRLEHICQYLPRFFQTHPDWPRLTQIYPDLPRFTEIHSDSSRFIQIHPDSSRYAQVPDSLRFIEIHPNFTRSTQIPDSPRFIQICPDSPNVKKQEWLLTYGIPTNIFIRCHL
jgi:hypothetical protein